MSEIRFPVTDKFHKRILKVCDKLGISKSEYVKSLIIKDIRKKSGYTHADMAKKLGISRTHYS